MDDDGITTRLIRDDPNPLRLADCETKAMMLKLRLFTYPWKAMADVCIFTPVIFEGMSCVTQHTPR